ncbi:epidermal retinol dehydrogenase 2 isoform X2 [Heterocephalus glaber]|nr:epidermal retinol dehydrogenase 2 isoform X2 [Heterocephalus glaber]XP_012923504.1 epidermal retinol dehydrogenase 2 isoform X2 [Heterocephalus glaber]XP_012923505.1 epidermal retinol dehydrogenase 2 isoform X2 [Heterocephalus glaber]XP_021105218.1 epidermal retinol dehydrogenase 2 isoform X2 [Heterocephalus glaber]XP_021105219.1 epidermal retinol dehydrogenase 2 isoform X2 [Heterocephalus glaber]XP_021105220.1 epidermal retinol dehydrogenase 2 isoform X2 [Heterocephalus glaber]
MASYLKTTKELLVFLGKSLFSVLKALIFTFIPKPRKNVAGETVLITGSGSGLGRLLALQFARLGSVLVLWDVNTEANEETCRMAQEAGAMKVRAYTCDCSQKEEVYKVADQVKKEVGDVSILINNAGIVTGKKFLDCPDELMEKSFNVNFKAHLWTYKAFLPTMIANNHGHLVCISSSAGLVGVNGLADYCASKFAAVGFAESMFVETFAQKQKGIKTTIVCPFFIKTGMFEGCTTSSPTLLPILEPEYVVRKIIDAILQEQLYLYMPKFLYLVMFLKSVLPVKTGLLIADYVGAFNVMDGFTGQKKKT